MHEALSILGYLSLTLYNYVGLFANDMRIPALRATPARSWRKTAGRGPALLRDSRAVTLESRVSAISFSVLASSLRVRGVSRSVSSAKALILFESSSQSASSFESIAESCAVEILFGMPFRTAIPL